MTWLAKGPNLNIAKALQWFRKAAEQGHTSSQNNLGNMYITGRGVPQDDAQAYMWFNLAASRFPPARTAI